jgi:hypothetical protein
MFAVMKIFVTDISASTGRNDFIFDIWLWHGDLYCVSPFQVYCTSTSCLQSVEIYTNLTQMNEHVSKIKSFLPVATETSLNEIVNGRTDKVIAI